MGGGGAGGRINKPKTSKMSCRKRTRERTKPQKRGHIRSDDTLSSTTDAVLRQCRYITGTNTPGIGKSS